MTRKTYVGDYDMPTDIETAALAFSEALQRNGFNSGSISACPPLGSTEALLYTWKDEGIESTCSELRDGRWRRYEWTEGGDD